MRILVVGLGRMGSFIARALGADGNHVEGYDVDQEASERAAGLGVKALESMPDPSAYEAVICAVPLRASAPLAEGLAPRMRDGGLYIDVSSLKAEVNGALRRAGGRATKVSVHPLFGPGAGGFSGGHVVLTPVEDAEAELRGAEAIFRGAKFTIMDGEEHDRAMAYSITVPQVLGYLFRSVTMGEARLPTASRMMQELAAAVEVSDPRLAADMLLASGHARSALDQLADAVEELRAAITAEGSGNGEGLAALLERFRGEWPAQGRLYELAYDALRLTAGV